MYSPPKILLPLLWPLSLIYGAVVVARAWLYKVGILRQKRLNGVVISVGNLTVGGTGKTPMVIWLAQRLGERGKRVGVLTRGYKGRDRGNSDGDIAYHADEPALIQSRLEGRVPIGVGSDRFQQGSSLEREGIDWFVLDDGFQHLPLARDLDIVLIDASLPLGSLLPAGPFREPLSALARADIVILTRTTHAPALEAAIRRHTQAPIFCADTSLVGFFASDNATGIDLTSVPAFAMSGIANPLAFSSDLQRWGINVVGRMNFPDHHWYINADLQQIESAAQSSGASAIVCTEKDFYNLGELRFQKLPLRICRIETRVSEPSKFWDVLDSTLAKKRREGVR